MPTTQRVIANAAYAAEQWLTRQSITESYQVFKKQVQVKNNYKYEVQV